MGRDVAKEAFDESDYALFGKRLEDCLRMLGQVLGEPGFGVGPATIGAELELFLIDPAGRPFPENQAVRIAAGDHRVTLELNKFNLELNATPVLLAGHPFGAVAAELDSLLALVGDAARRHGGRVAMIGILPTLTEADLGPQMVTDMPRYRALINGLRRLRCDAVRIKIEGEDTLEMTGEDVTMEGANTSFQLHLRVDPPDFAKVYNAVQLANAPVLAVSGNSPTFLGRRLWAETRVALFKQSVDDRSSTGPRRRPARTTLGTGWLRGGALDLFTESVRLYQPVLPQVNDLLQSSRVTRWPPLDELRLHQGTVWRWNRAIYDPESGGHLRIEMRALPAGPTVTDMMANSAFLIGLSLWLAEQDQHWTYALPFERADAGFHEAAAVGLAADLSWPAGGDRIRTVPAAELVAELVPAARQGLIHADVASQEADELLDVITERARSGQTGAAWQHAALAAAVGEHGADDAFARMLARYLELADSGQPVHTWPPYSPARRPLHIGG
jgi:gamma-glutamyl:cysteine ligase YbdK (ATP-grasp superfamily)